MIDLLVASLYLSLESFAVGQELHLAPSRQSALKRFYREWTLILDLKVIIYGQGLIV
jgi:hypothetical protein